MKCRFYDFYRGYDGGGEVRVFRCRVRGGMDEVGREGLMLGRARGARDKGEDFDSAMMCDDYQMVIMYKMKFHVLESKNQCS